MFVVCVVVLLAIRRDGESSVAVVEGDAHALAGSKPHVVKPEVGNLGPGHERRLQGGYAAVERIEQRHADAVAWACA